MEAVETDPRDATILTDSPNYRVDFWDDGLACDTWRLRDVVDVREALAWAETNCGDRTFVLYVEYVDDPPSARDGPDGTVGLCRLIGEDPSATGSWSEDEAWAGSGGPPRQR